MTLDAKDAQHGHFIVRADGTDGSIIIVMGNGQVVEITEKDCKLKFRSHTQPAQNCPHAHE